MANGRDLSISDSRSRVFLAHNDGRHTTITPLLHDMHKRPAVNSMAQLGGMKLTPSPGVAPIIRQPGAGVAPIIKQHGADVAPIIRHPGGMSYHPFVPRPASSMRTEPSPLRNTNMPNRPSMPPLSYGDNALNRKQLLEAMPVYTQTPGNHANAFKSNRNPIKDKDWDDLATEKKQRVSDKSPESVEPFAYADEAGMPPVDAVYIREYLQHQLRKLPSSTVRTVDEHAASAFELGIDCSMIAHHLHEACEATTNNETMSDEDIKVFRDEIRASLHQQCLESKLTTAEKNYLVSICSLHVAELDACRDLQELRNKVMILITRATLSASESKSTSLRPTEIIMLDNEGDKTGDQSESDSTRKMSKRLLHAMHEVLHFISEKFLCRKWNDKFVHRCFSEEVDPWQPNQKTSTSMLISVDLESADLKDALFSGKRPSADKPVRIHCKRCSGGVFEGLYECMSGFAFHTKCIHGIQDHIKRNGNTCFATSFVFFRARNPAIV